MSCNSNALRPFTRSNICIRDLDADRDSNVFVSVGTKWLLILCCPLIFPVLKKYKTVIFILKIFLTPWVDIRVTNLLQMVSWEGLGDSSVSGQLSAIWIDTNDNDVHDSQETIC